MSHRISEELETLFMVKDYQWKIDGALRFPNADEIRQTIEKAMAELSDEPNGTQIEVGRLIIKKHSEGYAIYTLVGEVNDTNS